jgi:hypothetical protein
VAGLGRGGGAAIRTGEPRLALDVAHDPLLLGGRAGQRQYAVPIRSRGRILGAFNFENDSAKVLFREPRSAPAARAPGGGRDQALLLNARLTR